MPVPIGDSKPCFSLAHGSIFKLDILSITQYNKPIGFLNVLTFRQMLRKFAVNLKTYLEFFFQI